MVLEVAGERICVDPYVQLPGGAHPMTLEIFAREETILITHGHFDHLYDVSELLRAGAATVFCTETPAETLAQYTDAPEGTDNVVCIRPGMSFCLGKVHVKVLQGSHIRFDLPLILQTLLSPRMLRFGRNLPFLLWALRHYPEEKETLVYEITGEGKRIQILGSCNLDQHVQYQPGADLLVMPYQGKSSRALARAADRVLARLAPKRVLLTHFDDAFPPISRTVDLRPFKRLMKEKYPDVPVVRPGFDRPVKLS